VLGETERKMSGCVKIEWGIEGMKNGIMLRYGACVKGSSYGLFFVEIHRLVGEVAFFTSHFYTGVEIKKQSLGTFVTRTMDGVYIPNNMIHTIRDIAKSCFGRIVQYRSAEEQDGEALENKEC
jgi:hypothetical protein